MPTTKAIIIDGMKATAKRRPAHLPIPQTNVAQFPVFKPISIAMLRLSLIVCTPLNLKRLYSRFQDPPLEGVENRSCGKAAAAE